MQDSIYRKALEESFTSFVELCLSEVNSENFDWDQLVSLILEDDSPLQEIFSSDLVDSATVYVCARNLHAVASKDKVILKDEEIENKEEEFIDKHADYAEFEDVE